MTRYHAKANDADGNPVTVPFTAAEETAANAAEAAWAAGAEDRAWAEIRDRRDRFLAESDWRFLGDTPAPHANQAWRDYRQALRDITDARDPDSVVWPAPPA